MSKIFMLSSDSCGHCSNMKTALRDRIDSGEVEVVDISQNREARLFASIYGGVPTFLTEQNGKLFEVVPE